MQSHHCGITPPTNPEFGRSNETMEVTQSIPVRGNWTTNSSAGTFESADEGIVPGLKLFETTLLGIVLSTFIVSAISGNVLVMIAVLVDRNLRKSSNGFIFSLAMADALVAVLVMTFAMVNDLLGHWTFGQHFCRFWISSDIMCSTASILNLCAISLDRYIHIRWPLDYQRWITSRRSFLGVAIVWVFAALISFLPIHLGWHLIGTTDQDHFQTTDDSFEQCTMTLSPAYAVLSTTVSFCLPCLIMVLIYLQLYHYARIHLNIIRQFTLPVSVVSSASAGLHNSPAALYPRPHEHKASITLGVIMGVFLLCWTPFFTINIVGAFCKSCIPSLLFAIFTWLGYANSSMNPVIYCIFNHEFRSAFKRLLCPRKHRSVFVQIARQNAEL